MTGHTREVRRTWGIVYKDPLETWLKEHWDDLLVYADRLGMSVEELMIQACEEFLGKVQKSIRSIDPDSG